MDYSKTPLSDLLAQQSAIGLELTRRVNLLAATVDEMAGELDRRDADTETLLREGRY